MNVCQYKAAPDSQLVLYALVGDLSAYDELVRRYRPGVVLSARRVLGSTCGAEDVAQETFLLAFKALPQLEDHARFPSWLAAIARRCACKAILGSKRLVPIEQSKLDRIVLAGDMSSGIDPEAQAQKNWLFCLIEALLVELPSDHLDVMRLRYYNDWPVAKIGEFLMLPVTTVKWRLHVGRDLLRRRLEHYIKDEQTNEQPI